jgi:hypothetical protein
MTQREYVREMEKVSAITKMDTTRQMRMYDGQQTSFPVRPRVANSAKDVSETNPSCHGH